MKAIYKNLIAFHGHSCPGLAIGYRMTDAALTFLSKARAKDEELVAIVENNACGVDALQYLAGCTFGKGNLIFKDYGKHVYTLYHRKSEKGVRVVFNADNVPKNVRQDRNQFIKWLLTSPEEVVVSLKEVHIDAPEPAVNTDSVKCDFCGEAMMKTRAKKLNDKTACISCAEKYQVV